MELTSPVFDNNQLIPPHNSCDGQGTNPHLEIEDVPEEAQSLALSVVDPDAVNGPFVHWVVWNIPVETTDIEESLLPPEASEGINSANTRGYTPPCPPSGRHHYFFTLYALDGTFDLDPDTTLQDLQTVMQGHILDQAELVGEYERQF